ncbi:hypothetical protein FJT64_014644 [Amphibalanus amphitrite]|uniref:Immunoglobulin I-set domain-containing protein n=1 Tax=Amphibalanus amphitrite TaxID=1232801 RepID=A0A6A4VB56_AMPAM|nr:hypothetical protein FJT64_014644 [Amphibalanus amphitrite]
MRRAAEPLQLPLGMVPAVRGQQAVLEQRFCSDPAPSRVTWLWDDQRLQAGHVRGRFVADEVVQDSAEACYKTRLRIQSAGPADEQEYVIIVENPLGSDRHALALQVKGQ